MKERPILMSGPMVLAIMKGWKTETRRVIKFHQWADIPVSSMAEHNRPFKGSAYDDVHWNADHESDLGIFVEQDIRCPYGVVGDRLWVREAFSAVGQEVGKWAIVEYKADGAVSGQLPTAKPLMRPYGRSNFRTRPSIHMPRWASRLLLEVKDVRVERLQDITVDDMEAEGTYRVMDDQDCSRDTFLNIGLFMDLWDSLNAKRGFGWEANPWVWVVVFRRIDD